MAKTKVELQEALMTKFVELASLEIQYDAQVNHINKTMGRKIERKRQAVADLEKDLRALLRAEGPSEVADEIVAVTEQTQLEAQLATEARAEDAAVS